MPRIIYVYIAVAILVILAAPCFAHGGGGGGGHGGGSSGHGSYGAHSGYGAHASGRTYNATIGRFVYPGEVGGIGPGTANTPKRPYDQTIPPQAFGLRYAGAGGYYTN